MCQGICASENISALPPAVTILFPPGSQQEAGEKRVLWDGVDESGRGVPSGVYFYRLRAGKLDETRRMVLVK